ALKHAREVGFRVAALGGTPTIEHTPIRQAAEITDMLNYALEHERALVDAYTQALAACDDNAAYRNFLEELIDHEQVEVDEILRSLKKGEGAAGAKRGGKAKGKIA